MTTSLERQAERWQMFDECTCLAFFGETGRTEMCHRCFNTVVSASGLPAPTTLDQLDGHGIILLTIEYERMMAAIEAAG